MGLARLLCARPLVKDVGILGGVVMAKMMPAVAALTQERSGVIIGLDQKGKVVQWEPALVELTQFSRRDVFGMNFVKSFLTPDVGPKMHKAMESAFAGEQVETFSFQFHCLDGSPINLDVLSVVSSKEDQVNFEIKLPQDLAEKRAKAMARANEVVLELASRYREEEGTTLSNMKTSSYLTMELLPIYDDDEDEEEDDESDDENDDEDHGKEEVL